MLTHVGQTEYEAGLGGGQRMAEAGVTNALCVNQEVGNAALDQRCQGFTDGLAETGGTVEVLAVDLADPTGAQQRIEAALTADDPIDGILTLGPTGAAPALAALRECGQARDDPARDLRPLAGSARGDRGWRHALRHRSAAVPAGLPADRAADALRHQPEHDRQPGPDDRPWLRDAGKRGARHRALRGGHPLAYAWRPTGSTIPWHAVPLHRQIRGEDAMAQSHTRRFAQRASPMSASPRPACCAACWSGRRWAPWPARSSSGSFSRSSPAIRGFLSMRGTANYLEVAAELGILAVAVRLLMIGGEFDLSIGSTIGACGMIIALLSGRIRLEHLAGDARVAGLRPADRRLQRLSRAANRVAVIHHHARHAVHHSRRDHRHHPAR